MNRHQQPELTINGRWVVVARAALGWSRAELARRAGISTTSLGDFETNKRTPMHNNFRAVMRALGSAGVEFALDENDAVIGVRWPEGAVMHGVALNA